MSKATAAMSYIVGTILMAFGWLCALAQGDAPQQGPRIAGIVLGVGFQALVCLYVIAIEFTL